MSSSRLRTLLIGRGKWGSNFERCLRAREDFVLADVCGRDWRERLASSAYDAVIIATPPSSHFEILAETLKLEIPCVVEKPLTLDLKQALALEALHGRHPVPLIVDHIHIFSAAYETLKSELRERRAKILSVRSKGCGIGPFRDYSALWDYGPHDLAMALDLAQEAPLSASAKSIPKLSEAYEIELRFRGFQAVMEVGSGYDSKARWLEVRTDQGIWIYDDLAKSKLTLDGKPWALPAGTPMDRLLDRFGEWIQKEIPAPSGISLGVQVIKILDQLKVVSSSSP